MSKQTHIFATRTDLEAGLKEFESKTQVKYARCDLYYGPVYEHYLSLLDWIDLGSNMTGDHVSGPRFLIVPRDCKINLEPVPQIAVTPSSRPSVKEPAAWACDSIGRISKEAAGFEEYLAKLDIDHETKAQQPGEQTRYNVSQKANPDSISFLPGGIYKGEKVLVCGHIGTISESQVSRSLYRAFVNNVTRGFEKIGSYRVGPEAVRLMNLGYRMVTIGISSPPAYDLRRTI